MRKDGDGRAARTKTIVRLLPAILFLSLPLCTLSPAGPPVEVLGSAVEVQPVAFSVTGDVGPLSPGASLPIDLVVTNPYNFDLTVVDVTVRIGAPTRADGRPNPACAVDGASPNLAVTAQFSGPVVVPANSSRSLSQLAVPTDRWPVLTMPNLPVNQDACQQTVFPLAFEATGDQS